MKFTTHDRNVLSKGIEKIERYMAYKYGVSQKEVGLIFRNRYLHVMICKRLVESILLSTLPTYTINEETGKLTK